MDKSLRDVYLKHGINLTRYSNYEAQRLIKILDTSNSQIQGIIRKAKAIETKEKYYRVAAEIRRVTKECHEQLDGQVELDFMGLAAEETRFVEKALRGVSVIADFELPGPKKIWAAASFSSYSEQGHETFETYLNTLSENLYKTWDMQVRAGYLTGMTAKQINRAVLGTADGIDPGQMQVLRRSLETNTKTMVAHLAETARDAVYRENSSLFSGYRYLGTLDTRTCMVCGELDGKIFKEIEDAPALPQHLACRCLLVPVVKGMEEHDEDDTRASMDGPVSANMSYSDWLKTQPDEIVRDILGPARYGMFKRGAEISQFVADGKTLTLKQLGKVEGLDVSDSKRFTEQFNNFIKKSFEYIDSENKALSDRAISGIEYALKDTKDQRTIDEFIVDINKKIAQSHIARQDKVENFLQHIDQFEKDPRILTQFESNTSQGSLDREARNRWENRLVGNEENVNLTILDRERPVYSEVLIQDSWYTAASDRYGEMTIILSDSVRSRTSFTAGNSSVRPESFKSDIKQAFAKSDLYSNSSIARAFIKAEKPFEGYIEAQTWGGVDLRNGDVVAIAFRGRYMEKYIEDERYIRFIKVLEKYGVKIVDKEKENPSNVAHR
jgi:SPP1 gp7 family putative phage head morphogenesis protein